MRCNHHNLPKTGKTDQKCSEQALPKPNQYLWGTLINILFVIRHWSWHVIKSLPSSLLHLQPELQLHLFYLWEHAFSEQATTDHSCLVHPTTAAMEAVRNISRYFQFEFPGTKPVFRGIVFTVSTQINHLPCNIRQGKTQSTNSYFLTHKGKETTRTNKQFSASMPQCSIFRV